ncbi:MAG: hypothetical protein IPG99_19335 [Ignavibacteria bacterium]|nr:hypothetical protein [Ignavibacteria bacterium]
MKKFIAIAFVLSVLNIKCTRSIRLVYTVKRNKSASHCSVFVNGNTGWVVVTMA